MYVRVAPLPHTLVAFADRITTTHTPGQKSLGLRQNVTASFSTNNDQ